MNATGNALICAAVIVSLLAPAPVFANSLRPVAPKKSEQEQASAPSSQPGAQDKAPADEARNNPPASEQPGAGSENAGGEPGADPQGAAEPASSPSQSSSSQEDGALKQPQEDAATDRNDASPNAADAAGAAEPEAGPQAASDPLPVPGAGESKDTPGAADAGSPDDPSGEMLSLTALGSPRDDVGGKPLVIPDDTENVDFLNGNWSFDRTLVASNGKKLRADFSFDKEGEGVSTIVDDQNIRHTARARAFVNDGVLRIQTGAYTSPQTSQRYHPAFMECRNSGDGAVCGGTDGFSAWEGERMVSGKEQARVPEKPSGAGDRARSDTNGTGAPVESYAELSPDGAELSPTIMEEAETAKVKAGSATRSTLAGDWRYSRDLARKTDGESVALEFHFDADGRGYSLIRDGSGKDFKAPAEVRLMPDGTIRVKTDAYTNGSGQGYYPTFMECRSKQSSDLLCDVSNGWMRVNDGVLVSKQSLEEQSRRMSMEELLPVAPVAEPSSRQERAAPARTGEQAGERARAAQADANAESGVDIAGMLADMSAASAAQSATQASAQRATAAESARQGAALSLPAQDSSLSFLEGHWRCNTGLSRTRDNQPVVVEFRFDKQGKGTAAIRELSGRQFIASARATYKKGRLRINTSEFCAKGTNNRYSKSYIECVEQGARALCRGKNGGTTWSGASFIRLR